jgi:phosphoglycerate kinase
MGIKTISELDIAGRRLFIRVDFNVPLTPEGKVSDDTRIRESLPTIKLAIEKGARVILASHLGRPKGKVDKKYTLEPVAARLAELLDADVSLTDEPVGDGARKVVNDLHAGAVALLENLRFSPAEETNDETFSRELASYADVYVNDAFGTAHRAHASTVGITKFVGDKGMGLLMEREVKFLGKLLGDVERPFVAIIGGAKVSDKIGVLDNLLDRVDQMLIGGAMANTFLKAKGGQLGRSLVEVDKLALARAFLKKAEESNVDVLLPRDVVAAAGIKSDTGRVVQAMMVPEDLAALDIGPETARGFADAIARAKTIFWNGPMGVFESAPFAGGTMAVAKAVAAAPGALTVVGGGDSVAAIQKSGLGDKITHISTGGGASLEFLEGKKLPGLAALEQG